MDGEIKGARKDVSGMEKEGVTSPGMHGIPNFLKRSRQFRKLFNTGMAIIDMEKGERKRRFPIFRLHGRWNPKELK
jgi:hypothetical protein